MVQRLEHQGTIKMQTQQGVYLAQFVAPQRQIIGSGVGEGYRE
jgi:hypothetical protein